MNENNNRIRLIMLAVLAFILVFGGIIFLAFRNKSNETGSASIVLNVPDQTYLKATLNGESFKITGLNDSYTLKTGDYTLVIKKTGYSNFSTNFTVTKDESIVINANLKRTATSNPINTDEIGTGNTDITITTISGTQYFYDKTWAVATVQTADGNSGLVVMNYNDSAKKWYTMLGPDTIFSSDSLVAIPDKVVDYLTQNNYIINNAE